MVYSSVQAVCQYLESARLSSSEYFIEKEANDDG